MVNQHVDFSAGTRSQNIEKPFVNGATNFSERVVMACKHQPGILGKADPPGKRQVVD